MKISQSRSVFLFIFLACAGALTVALMGQYAFGLRPCILCLYERIPYAVAGVVAVLMMGGATSWRVHMGGLWVIALAFVVNSGLGLYHVGVENHWWENAACTGGPMEALSLSDLKAAIRKPISSACDDVQWSLFGITLAGYNLLFSVALTLFCLGVAKRIRRAS